MPWWAIQTDKRGATAYESETAPPAGGALGDGDRIGSVLCRPYATEAEALAHFGPEAFCVECGHRINSNYMEPARARLLGKSLCFRCDFWADKVGQKHRLVIDGRMYTVGEVKWPQRGGGFGGRQFDIETSDGNLIRTCDLWHQGEVPTHFRDRLPDNARFVDGEHWVQCGETWCLAKA